MNDKHFQAEKDEIAAQLQVLATSRTKPITDEAASTTWANAGGAKRSSPMLPWEMIWWGALRGMLTRFKIGLKYGYQNWKRALSVPRAEWHKGEPGLGAGDVDASTLGFVRQFYAHAAEHWYWVTQLVDKPVGATSPKGDTLEDNAYAWLWNVGCAVEYLVANPDLFRETFSQWPVDSPFHRLDLAPNELAKACVNVFEAGIDDFKLMKDIEKHMTAKGTVRKMLGDFEIVRVR